MKTTHFLISALLFLTTACKNDDNDQLDPVDQLPPVTQTGTQKFGCLVDGEPFLPSGFGQNVLSAYIQNINGEYYLNISAPSPEIRISIHADAVEVLQEKEYPLLSEKTGIFFATYNSGLITKPETYLDTTSSDQKPGVLKITNHDSENFIISGTFEFSVTDKNGEEIKITDGRFDLNYTN